MVLGNVKKYNILIQARNIFGLTKGDHPDCFDLNWRSPSDVGLLVEKLGNSQANQDESVTL